MAATSPISDSDPLRTVVTACTEQACCGVVGLTDLGKDDGRRNAYALMSRVEISSEWMRCHVMFERPIISLPYWQE